MAERGMQNKVFSACPDADIVVTGKPPKAALIGSIYLAISGMLHHEVLVKT